MSDSLPPPPAHAELRAGLAEIHQRIADVEAGVENASMSHRDVINASADIAARLRALGRQHPDLGKALDNPRVFEDVYEPSGTAGGPERIRTDQLGAETGPRRVVAAGDHRSLDIPEGTPVLYVLRDRTSGAILKVGRTRAGRHMEARFGRYDSAGRRLELDLELEVTPLTNLRGQSLGTYENNLRAGVEDAGNVLPWDYTGRPGRMGRAGPGVPFEGLPGGSRLRKQGYRWATRGPRRGYLVPNAADTEL
jgi:hypothetical protein